jgi:hypothetical protein
MILRIVAIALSSAVLLAITPASPEVGPPFVDTGTIEIATTDEDGESRETPIWIVVLDGEGYVRTNDSRWLANIRRGTTIEIRAEGTALPVSAEEVEDDDTKARVEEAFKEKYGGMQRVMSFFRISEPTVLRLRPQ